MSDRKPPSDFPAGYRRIGCRCLPLILFLLSASVFPASAKIPLIGDLAPAFSGRDATDKMIYSSDYFGLQYARKPAPSHKAIILAFCSKDCPRCEHLIPGLVQFYQGWNPAGVEVLMIHCLSKPQELKSCQQKYKIPFLVVSDQYGLIAQSYGVIAFPRIFILDPRGKITQMIIGEDTNLNQTLEREMTKMGIKTQPNSGGANK
jgi:peroxiredoxin